MIARLNRTVYYADSLARSTTQKKILSKKYQKMIQGPVQKRDNLCGFYKILAAFNFNNLSYLKQN